MLKYFRCFLGFCLLFRCVWLCLGFGYSHRNQFRAKVVSVKHSCHRCQYSILNGIWLESNKLQSLRCWRVLALATPTTNEIRIEIDWKLNWIPRRFDERCYNFDQFQWFTLQATVKCCQKDSLKVCVYLCVGVCVYCYTYSSNTTRLSFSFQNFID